MQMDLARLYVIDQTPGYSVGVGRLVSMLTYARYTTLESIKGLTTKELDYIPEGFSNSIGALLRHIASVETYYYIESFERRGMTQAEMLEWSAAMELGERARAEIIGFSLNEYTSLLNQIREKTLDGLKQKSDEWLHEVEIFDDGTATNNHWRWFHVLEDELNHRGQIRIIRKNLTGR